MNPTLASWLPTLVSVPLVAFALYRRVRRTFGRQPVTPKRMVLRIVLLTVLCVVFLVGLPTPIGFASAATGAVLGGLLAMYGLKHTQYDVTPEGRGYTPNPWIGLAVTALFLGRLVARMFSVYEATVLAPSGPSFQRSPLTLGIFFLMAVYYAAYYVGVLRKARELVVPELPPE